MPLLKSLLTPCRTVSPIRSRTCLRCRVRSSCRVLSRGTTSRTRMSPPPPTCPPPPDRHPSSCHISTFVALSPQYRLNIQAGTALGEATEEGWDEVLLEQGEVLVMVSTARHRGLPSPPGQTMQGALFTQLTPDRRHSGVKPNTTHLDPLTPLELKDCLGLLKWGGVHGGGRAHVRATFAVGCWIGGSGGAGQGRGGRRLQDPPRCS